MARLRVLAMAVATGRIGYVFLVDGVLMDWQMSKKANTSVKEARNYATKLIKFLKPDVVVTERIDTRSRKGDYAKEMTETIASVAANHELLDITVPRLQAFKNKYAEARDLVLRFPELKPQLPKKPPIWLSEPYSTIYFEALALALLVIDRKIAT